MFRDRFPHRRRATALALLFPILVSHATAQSEVVNFEAVTTNGLAVAQVGAKTFLLACNPNDNAVAVIDTATNALVARVPVGLCPVAVAWDPATSRFFTANKIGDSVTAVELTAPGGVAQTRLIATELVEDDPQDVAIGPGGRLCVALGSRSMLTRLDTTSLAVVDAYLLTDPFTGLDVASGGVAQSLVTGRALRVPRRIVVDGNRVHVIALKGDTGYALEFHAPGAKHDLITLTFGASVTAQNRGSFGSTNEAAVLGKDGNLYVVGGMARHDVEGDAQLRVLPSGFVESHLYRLGSGYTSGSITEDRDLNFAGSPVAPGDSAAMPAGLAILHNGSAVDSVFVASFGTDRIVRLKNTGGSIGGWTRSWFQVPAPVAGGTMSGPRDMEIVSTPAGPRLFVLDELDAAVSVFDPTQSPTAIVELARIALPSRLSLSQRQGRRFLYDARISGTGKVSCASCHVDGRTDSLSWHLGDTVAGTGADMPNVVDPITGVVLEPTLDGVTNTGSLLQGSAAGVHAFPRDKGRMMTQSLQGLVTHPVAQGQDLFSVGELHWRGDRRTFARFNEAFVNLMGAQPTLGSGTGLDAKGIPETDMTLFQLYVESIVYEPNAEQPRDREFSGSFGADWTGMDGNGAKRGLENFVGRRNNLPGPTTPAWTLSPVALEFAGRSCVQCHGLPAGTNGRICLTDVFGGAGEQPAKSAQLRSLHQRDGVLEFFPSLPLAGWPAAYALPAPVLGQSGLTHSGDRIVPTGDPASVNRFMSFFFNAFYGIGPAIGVLPDWADETARLHDLVAFVREFDTGSAPVIGLVSTFRGPGTGNTANVALMEQQAEIANCDVVVHRRQGTVLTGFYYDVVGAAAGTPRYLPEAGGAAVTRAQLIAAGGVAGDAAIFQAVPVGSGRRIASVTGNGSWAAVATGAPSNIVLRPMLPAPHWSGVARIEKNWNTADPANPDWDDFLWAPLQPLPDPVFPRAQRIFQQWLTSTVVGPGVLPAFGVTSRITGAGPRFHHEPPRRFRVSGTNIQPGARLLLLLSADGNNPVPNCAAFKLLELNLFPVRTGAGGTLEWETAAELDALWTLALLNGGPFAPDVLRVMYGAVDEGATNLALDPIGWNKVGVFVINANGQASPFGNIQPLTIAD